VRFFSAQPPKSFSSDPDFLTPACPRTAAVTEPERWRLRGLFEARSRGVPCRSGAAKGRRPAPFHAAALQRAPACSTKHPKPDSNDRTRARFRPALNDRPGHHRRSRYTAPRDAGAPGSHLDRLFAASWPAAVKAQANNQSTARLERQARCSVLGRARFSRRLLLSFPADEA
jgi:hypothetical protein